MVSQGHDWPEWLHSAVVLNSNLGALPMVKGNSAHMLPDYTGTFDAMIGEFDTATSYVHVEFYILVLDPTTAPFFQALARATGRGVAVRVLSDDLAGLMFLGRTETIKYLQDIGAEYHLMLPLRPLQGKWQRPDLRNHRKILVMGGRVGFTGSQNPIDASYNKKGNLKRGLQWHELMMHLEGPVVRELDAVFATDWYSETDVLLPLDSSAAVPNPGSELIDAQVLPSGPSFDNDNILKLYATLRAQIGGRHTRSRGRVPGKKS